MIAMLALWAGETKLSDRCYMASAWEWKGDYYMNYMGTDIEYGEQCQTYCFGDATVRVGYE